MAHRILVVEDSPTQAELLRLLLEGAGYQVNMAENGREGLEKLRLSTPDLIISDVTMPEMDGFAFCRAVKSAEETKHIPFVLLTQRNTPQDILSGLASGADNFIPKPFDDEQLIERVRRIFEHLEFRKQGQFEMDVTLRMGGREIVINPDKQQIIELLFSTFEDMGRLNDELQESERKLEDYAVNLEAKVEERTEAMRLRGAALEAAASAIIITNRAGEILWANPAFALLTGYAVEEVLGRSPRFLKSGRQSAESYRDLWTTVLDGRVWRGELVNRRKDGSLYTEEMTITPVRDKRGEIAHLIAIKQDITERTQAEAERNKTLLWQQGINLVQESLLVPAPLEEKLRNITDSIVRLFGTDFCRIWLIRPGDLCERGCVHAGVTEGPHVCRSRDRCLHLLASSGRYTHIDGKTHRRVPFGAYKIGRVASSEDHKFLTNDAPNDPRVHNHEWARELGLVSFAGYQLRIPGGETLGVLALFAKHPILPVEDSLLDGLSSALAQAIQQAQAEGALHASEMRFRRLFESARDGIFLLDASSGEITDANPFLMDLLGYTREEILGRRLWEVSPFRDIAMNQEQFGELQMKEYVHYEHLPLETKDGRSVDVEFVSNIYQVDEERIIQCNVRDITDRKRLEAERTALEAQLRQQQKLEAIGTLASGVAHEINNPITGIMNYAQLIADMASGSQAGEYAQEIVRETERVATIVRNLLQFARQEKQGHSPARLVDIVEQTLSLLRAVFRHDQITLTVDVPEDLPSVKCRSQQIQQVLMNLLTNARDALNAKFPGYHPDKTIRVTAREVSIICDLKAPDLGPSIANRKSQIANGGAAAPRWLRLTVADQGPGIPAEICERIFDPFFTTKPRDQGTGLGLSISHGIVQDHGGKLHFETDPDTGTQFHLDLPVEEKE